MSIYAFENGQVVDAKTGRVINLADEEAWLDRKEIHEEPRRAMARIVDWIVRESKYQSRTG